MAEGRVVKVAKAPKQEVQVAQFDSLGLLTELCYHYPRYSLAEARRLPFFHVRRLLNQAAKQRARNYYELTQIAAAPHTRGGELYSQLIENYKEQANG